MIYSSIVKIITKLVSNLNIFKEKMTRLMNDFGFLMMEENYRLR